MSEQTSIETPSHDPWIRWHPDGRWMNWRYGNRASGKPMRPAKWKHHGTLTMTPHPGSNFMPYFEGVLSHEALQMADDRGFVLAVKP